MTSSPLFPKYRNLIDLLHPSHSLPQILELDILPSSFPSKLYSSPPSLALPKPLLASLFVTAHAEFFTYITSRKRVPSENKDDRVHKRPGDGGSPTNNSFESGGDSRYDAALSATRVLLLWDPNHITAANFRKKHLLSRAQSIRVSIPDPHSTTYAPASPATIFLFLLRSELSFLTSLVTSPLPKAPKASTLWAHRLWLLRSFHTDVLTLFQQEQVDGREPEEDAHAKLEDKAAVVGNKVLQTGETASSSPKSVIQYLYTTELHIIMRASDRHPRNFYAWGYARALFIHLTTFQTSKYPTSAIHILSLSLVLSVLTLTHSWCMTHPRDISGWTFLVFLIQKLGLGSGPLGSSPAGAEFVGGVLAGDVDMQGVARREVDRILNATTEAAERFQWRGESVRWFLKSISGRENFSM